VETTTEDTQTVISTQPPKTAGFLNKWLEKGRQWLNDDDIKDF
jgi:hypothetical protein